jgi:predicted RNA-binding protein with TRAM domain
MITSYVIQPVVGGANLTPQTFSGASNTVNVPGLTNGENYTFTVTAINAAGTGAASAPSNAVLVGAPGAPTAVTPIPPWGNMQVTISWTAPPGNGAPITEYEITAIGGSTGMALPPQDFFSSATTETVTGLENGYGWSFTVRAANQFGFGPESALSSSAGRGSSAPGPPSGVTASPGTAAATVSWTAALANGNPITAYVVTPYVAGVAQSPQTFNTTATSDTLSGLISGTAYTFTVAAVNGFGEGPQSMPSNAVTVL